MQVGLEFPNLVEANPYLKALIRSDYKLKRRVSCDMIPKVKVLTTVYIYIMWTKEQAYELIVVTVNTNARFYVLLFITNIN